MKNYKIYNKLISLCTKYNDTGFSFHIEFAEFGMIIRGYFCEPSNINNMKCFNREYSKYFIKEISDDIDIETILDDFKNEFEHKLKEETI